MDCRTEKDLLGEKKLPGNAYWGIHTARALENFSLSCRAVNLDLIKALVMVKKAAAQANHELGYLDNDKFLAIEQACDEVSQEKFNSSFIVDSLCGGAGTSINMNVNEVLANRALEILGKNKGDYRFLHPIEDVNMHQSTNDVFPSSVRIAVINKLKDLSAVIVGLQGAFQQKEKTFVGVLTIGRSELQEAVPISLGAEFGAFAQGFERDRWRTFKCEERLRVVNIGGTAIGTGLGAPRSYIFLVIEKLRVLTGLGLSRAENLVDATANCDTFAEVAAILKAHAQNIIKVSNDLRLLHLLGEIVLPSLQAGSSLMPGKVNPVVCEAAVQTAIRASSDCDIIAESVGRGTLQINEFMPLIADCFMEALGLLTATDRMLTDYVNGIEVDESVCQEYLEHSLGTITAFVPIIGYEKATGLIQEFKAIKGNNVRNFLIEKLGKELVDNILSSENIMSLGYKDVKRA